METLLLGIVAEGEEVVVALDGDGERWSSRGVLEHVVDATLGRVAGRAVVGVAADAEPVVALSSLPLSRCRAWEAELAGALGGRPGVVVHSGMRAYAMAVNAGGQALRVQQTDEVLGEEGSALWLSSRALRMAVQGEAGRMQRSERLHRTLLACFAADSLDELVIRFESGQISREEMAGFIPSMLHLGAYPDPEPACRALLLQASRRLATLARTATEKAEIAGPAAGSWTGSTMHAPLTEILVDDVKHTLDGISWASPRADAVEGALMLASAVARAKASPGPVGPRVWQALLQA